jgi:hypothetical protein
LGWDGTTGRGVLQLQLQLPKVEVLLLGRQSMARSKNRKLVKKSSVCVGECSVASFYDENWMK